VFIWESCNVIIFVNLYISFFFEYIFRFYLRLKRLLPENDIERVSYILELYEKTLDFLLSRGAYLVHVSPQFLLHYDDYLISIDIMQSKVSYELPATNYLCL